MPFLLPQVKALDSSYDGNRPLPHRLERVARLVAADDRTVAAVARACRISAPSIYRLKRQPAFQARVARLRHLAAERALAEEPLALKGNRVVMAGRMARTLRDQLEANEYTTTLGVSKQGNPIVGFDRARVAELRQYLQLIADELDPKRSTIADSNQTVGVQATVTLDQAVVKVQALLSRVADAGDGQRPGTPQAGTPPGYGGVQADTVTMGEDGAVLDTEYNEIRAVKGEGDE